MEWILVILLVVIAVLLAVYLYRAIRSRVMGSFLQSAIIDEVARKYGGRNPHNKHGNLRIKDLQKHPRSRSEAEVIRYLEEITGDKFPTVYPNWLVWRGKTLELDGFNGKIALEFSGPLHTKWNPQFESYIEYFERVVRDVVKLRLCKKHKIPLIVVDASLPSRHWRTYLLSRLFDIGVVKEKPIPYIEEQVAEPFRNPQLEEELGLGGEMKLALKL